MFFIYILDFFQRLKYLAVIIPAMAVFALVIYILYKKYPKDKMKGKLFTASIWTRTVFLLCVCFMWFIKKACFYLFYFWLQVIHLYHLNIERNHRKRRFITLIQRFVNILIKKRYTFTNTRCVYFFIQKFFRNLFLQKCLQKNDYSEISDILKNIGFCNCCTIQHIYCIISNSPLCFFLQRQGESETIYSSVTT